MVEEGWYTDPQDDTRLRYWDGVEWTEHTHDRPDDEPPVEDEPVAEVPAVEESLPTEPAPEEYQVVEEAPSVEPPVQDRAPVEEWAPIQPPPTRHPPHQRPMPPPPPPLEPVPPPPPPAPVPSPMYTPDVSAPSRSSNPVSLPVEPADAVPAFVAQQAPHTVEPYPPTVPDQPPFVPEPDPDLGLPTARPGHLNDIGLWLRRTFKVGLSKLAHCVLLTVLGFVPGVFFYAVAYLALSEISNDGGLQGTTLVMIVLLVVLFLLWMLWVGVVALAQNHLLYHAHIGSRSSLGQSIQAGFQGVGRLAWAYLTLVVYLLMVVVVVGGLTFLFSLVSDTLGGVFFVVAYVAAMALSIWLGVKLIFLVVAAAVAPPGDRPMVVSVDTTMGYFWAVLGRMLLLGLILSLALVPVMLIFGGLFGTVGASFIDDPSSGTATAVVGAIALGGVLYLLVTLAMQVFSTSGIVRLYVDLGGPAQPVQPERPAAAQP